MNVKALAAVMEGIAPVIREYVAKSIEGFGARLKALEERPPVPGPAGPAGEPGPPGVGEKGEPGEKGDKGDPGERGEAGQKGEAGAQGERGSDGAVGAPGVRGDDGQPGPRGEPGPPGERGPAGPEGAEGKPGRDGRDGLPGVQGEKGLDGRDGVNGKDGIDGLGFDDIHVEHDGERGFTFKFVQGDRVKTFGAFRVPCQIYRGVYQVGKSYDVGDSVTWGGSQWTATAPTMAKPGEAGQDSRAWTLSVQRGRDGKQGPKGERGEFVTVKADGRR
ncbi:MAG TPA: hypothetical protein VJ777_32475 [Mycobacterium sp.]|nr:hypothetical protein [Mycobacterium sp.]